MSVLKRLLVVALLFGVVLVRFSYAGAAEGSVRMTDDGPITLVDNGQLQPEPRLFPRQAPDAIPHQLSVTGFDVSPYAGRLAPLVAVSPAPTGGFTASTAVSTPGTFFVFLTPAAAVGDYQVTLTVPDGRTAAVTIHYTQALLMYSVKPSDTDPAIDDNGETHLVFPSACATPRGQLLLYLPGTGGRPFANDPVVGLAARDCFDAIFLSYPNQTAAVEDCIREAPTPDCYEVWRLEKIDGIDRSPKIAVSPANAIENRLVKLLAYLDAQHPSDGWNRYLDASGATNWANVVVGGLSQGGGQAAMIAKVHSVARVVMLASVTDAVGSLTGPAPAWESKPGATPADRYYGFANVRDAFRIGEQNGWLALGLDQFGPIVDVDQAGAPYGNSHRLSTNVACANPSADNCAHPTVADPRNAQAFTPVWEYMLGVR